MSVIPLLELQPENAIISVGYSVPNVHKNSLLLTVIEAPESVVYWYIWSFPPDFEEKTHRWFWTNCSWFIADLFLLWMESNYFFLYQNTLILNGVAYPENTFKNFAEYISVCASFCVNGIRNTCNKSCYDSQKTHFPLLIVKCPPSSFFNHVNHTKLHN